MTPIVGTMYFNGDNFLDQLSDINISTSSVSIGLGLGDFFGIDGEINFIQGNKDNKPVFYGAGYSAGYSAGVGNPLPGGVKGGRTKGSASLISQPDVQDSVRVGYK